MKKTLTNELKTGIVVFLAILVAIFFWVRTSDFRPEPYRLKAYFSHADGIKENAIVTLAGIESGRVEKVQFVYNPDSTKVELVLAIDKGAKVREDAIAFIATTGFVGDAYVGLTPGESNKFLKNNDTVLSEDPVEMRELMKRADEIAENLNRVLGDVKTIVSGNRRKVDGIVTNLEMTSANFRDFSEDIKQHPWKLLMKGSRR